MGQAAKSGYELVLENRNNGVPLPEFGISVVVIERMSSFL